MKNEKLRIEDFLNNELKNQIKIVGGDDTSNDGTIDIRPLGGPRVIGAGGGDVEPIGGTTPINDPSNM